MSPASRSSSKLSRQAATEPRLPTTAATAGGSAKETCTTENAPERIMAAAEALFAAKGFDISLREITARAQVNGAAVNYHFGSKDKLAEILFDRVSSEVNGKRLKDLARITKAAKQAGTPPDLDDVILAFIKPYLEPTMRGHLLARLILQHRIDPTDLTRQIIKAHFDPMAKRFIDAFRLAVPSVDPDAFFWRYVFMIGAVVLTVTDSGPGNRLERLSGGTADPTSTHDFQNALLAFLKGGLLAPTTASSSQQAGCRDA